LQFALRSFAAPVVLTTGLLLLSGAPAAAQTVNPQENQGAEEPQELRSPRDAAPANSLVNLAAPNDPTVVPYKPITLRQKYQYSIEQMFSGPRLIAILAHAGFDQAEDNPHAWGSNAPAFGIRTASLFGRSFLRATAGSGIRALDHEDPRYFYSHKADNWARTKYALVHTFEVRNDNGSMMPAYSRFIGNFGMPFLAQTWHPGGINPPVALRSGAVGLAVGMGMSVAQEFWPDVKHAFHLGPGVAGLVSPGTIH